MTIPNASELQAAFDSQHLAEQDVALCAGAIDGILSEIAKNVKNVVDDGAGAFQDKVSSKIIIYSKFRNTELAGGIIARGIKEVIEPLGYDLTHFKVYNSDGLYKFNNARVEATVMPSAGYKPVTAIVEDWTGYPTAPSGSNDDEHKVKYGFIKMFKDLFTNGL